MRGDIPIPGSTKAKLINAGIRLFSEQGYGKVEVDKVAAEAGVTVGALYHHFQSKKNFYGILRDDMTKRILDRMEAVAESTPPDSMVKAALLAAYDGVVRIKAGRLLTDPDPRGKNDAIADYLGELTTYTDNDAAEETGIVLAAALRAALSRDMEVSGGEKKARKALNKLLK